MKEMLVGMFLAGGLTTLFWALGKFLPGLIVPKLHALFEQLRSSRWMRDPSRPKRLAWLKATLELIEEELPEPGASPAFYDPAGAYIASALRGLGGSPKQWSTILAKLGDAFDTELDADLKAMNEPPSA